MAIIRDNTTIANTLKIENDGSIDANLRLSGASVTVGQKTATNSLGVVLASDTTLPLPAGAATSALQPALVSGRLPVDGSAVTQPVSIAALPALTTGSSVIGSISNTSFVATQATAANLNATIVGSVTANAGTNLNTSTLAIESGGNLSAINVATGTQADAAYTGSGNSTVVGVLKAIYTKLAGTVSVSGTFFQATQPVSISSIPLPTGAAVESGGNLASLNTKLPAQGQALAATSLPVVLTVAQVAALAPLSTVAVTAASLPLPTGAATSALQPMLVGGRMPVDGSGVTQPVSIATLPALATGANAIGSITNTTFIATQATAANLNATVVGTITANAGTNLNTSALAIETGNLATLVTSNAAINSTNGTQADAVYAGSGNSTIVSTLKGVYAAIKGILTVIGPVGTPTDRSGTITTGGTAQVLMASSSTRYTLFISNPDASNDLWVAANGLTAAANGTGSIRILANGGGLGLKLPDPVRTAISIVGSTTGQKFTSWEA